MVIAGLRLAIPALRKLTRISGDVFDISLFGTRHQVGLRGLAEIRGRRPVLLTANSETVLALTVGGIDGAVAGEDAADRGLHPRAAVCSSQARHTFENQLLREKPAQAIAPSRCIAEVLLDI